ncbi:sugar ABC transporter substrate-binding protein [Thioclava sp. 15-R06ZXC-3]|uniref:Sugar ABC transporter substrate-binding protein n=1 Tax=Thioclava arctica TaxID=3238301 RepID=A0ABV3TQ76_9RHOB
MKKFLMAAGLAAASMIASHAVLAESAKKVCFAYQTLETEFWVAGHKAMTESLAQKGVDVIEVNANGDANKQLEQVRDCITQGVDGIIIIPQDGESVIKMIGEANDAGVPVAVFNRPPNPSNTNKAIVVVADNVSIAEAAVQHLTKKARELKLNRKVQPLIMVGALADTNAIGRREGFLNVINANPDLFAKPIEVPTEWDANVALANLESALQANPNVDMIFTSSDFLFPQIRAVLLQQGRWVPQGQDGHMILGGLDGDVTACKLIRQGYVDATGVQDLFFEADATVNALMEAIKSGNKAPNQLIPDKGFALTQDNEAERHGDMWGCVLADQ